MELPVHKNEVLTFNIVHDSQVSMQGHNHHNYEKLFLLVGQTVFYPSSCLNFSIEIFRTLFMFCIF
jgi:hypothetical protein